MKRVSVKDLVPKQDVESIFFVKHTSLMEAKDGKKYLNIIFSDATGDLEGRSWADAEKIFESVEKGNFAKVKGKANLYLGKKQFILQEIEVLDKKDIDMSDFILKAKADPNQMFQELKEIVEGLDDVYIRDMLKHILLDSEIERRLKKWQAGKSIHHAYQSGLLEHILSCSRLAISLSAVYGVNKNYVVCGAIMHDLCKIYELTDDINVEYTEEGKLVGHLVKGMEMVDRFAYRVKDFPYQTKLHIKHILLSHHGEYEYGSPKIPQTSEAMLVHLIDLMDSKMNGFETVKRTDNNSGHWSAYVRHLDRIIYKDDLPFFPDYTNTTSPLTKREPQKIKKEASKSLGSSQLKQNLGDALKGFKVEK